MVSLRKLILLAALAVFPSLTHADRVIVEYWEKWTGIEADAMKSIIADFNASQDRIEVRYRMVSQIEMKLMLAIAGRKPPDIAGIWSYSIPVYVENNALLPLDSLAAKSGISEADYLPSIWNLCVYRGRLWGLPSTPASTALHWNKRLFREAGLDPEKPPTTIAELEEFNEKITRKGPGGNYEVFGHLPEEPDWWNTIWGYWFRGSLWDGKDTLTPDSPENLRAGEWIASYPKRFGVRSVSAFLEGLGGFASPLNPFIRGQVAMTIQGPWMWNFLRKYGSGDFELGVAPFPTVDGKDPPVTLAEADVLVIPMGAKHVEEAWEFITYVNQQGPMEKLCMAQCKFSPLSKVSESFWENHPHPYIRVFYDLAASPGAKPVPFITIWNQYKAELDQAVKEIWALRKTPEQAFSDVRKRMQPKFDQKRKRWEDISEKVEAQWEREEPK